MNTFKQIMIEMSIPIMVDIVNDMITPEGVVKFREAIIEKSKV